MRLPADGPTGRILEKAALLLMLALGGCGSSGGYEELLIAAPQATGPRADYPVVVGEPYRIAGTTYTPEDVMNYDAVGFAAADRAGGSTVSGAHHTLPLPSYVEVTSLETGRTIVARLERRGPMDTHELIALSQGALAQLEAAPGAPVRVRRVNPPEDQRALLRAGARAALRMDTPGGAPPLPPLDPRGSDVRTSAASVQIATVEGAFVVQAAAFSTSERAERAAIALGGEVSRSGRYFRVRTGPFATRGEAEASLAKVRAAGYSDARILTNG